MANVTPNDALENVLKSFHLPDSNSHKGQNGRLLIIGGSLVFHSASLWACEVASHFVDLVHYCSTQENNQIFINLKTKFTNGIVVPRKLLLPYVEENDCILLGIGMERGPVDQSRFEPTPKFEALLDIVDEASYTYSLIKFIIENYRSKRFIFDAAALQVMPALWLKQLENPAIVTPHTREFEVFFGLKLEDKTIAEKSSIVEKRAQKYNCVIVLKSTVDIVSDGKKTVLVSGGNSGLSKGGTGDVLAGLIGAFYTKNNPMTSSILASFIVKTAAETLYPSVGLWFNTADLIKKIPRVAKQIFIDPHED